MNKKLIINADDYGICREVNDAIEDLILTGKLQNVSVLTNTRFYEPAAEFLINRKHCGVGIHLNAVEGSALSPNDQVKALLGNDVQFLSLSKLLFRWLRAPSAVSKALETEWRAQIELLLKSGLNVSHADSHQHIHAFPPFWKILVKLCREYGIPAIRTPRERNRIGSRNAAAFALTQSVNVSKSLTVNQNIATNDHFLGFKRAGSYGETELIEDLQNLNDGVTELCLHPSLSDRMPYQSLRGALEYEALSSERVWRQIARSKIQLLTWAELAESEYQNELCQQLH